MVPRYRCKSSHRSNYRISRYKSYNATNMVMVGNGSNLSIFGNATFTIPNTSMKLKNTLIVPSLQKKLLIISKFTTDYNCCLIFYPWGFLIKDLQTRQVLFKGLVHDGLYPLSSSHSIASPMVLVTNKVSSNTWHARLDHLNIRTLHTLLP